MKAEEFRFDGSRKCDWKELPTGAGKEEREKKDEIIAKTEKNVELMGQLQDMFYADGREGLVIVLQAIDAAGKDSTIRHVMSGLNPQGVKVSAFKQPSVEELAHDYLWRINCDLPRRGEIGIFNRSYYEDVMAVRVRGLWKGYKMADRVLNDSEEEFFAKRYRQIRDYEEYLYENSYRVVKILLNLSQDKQKERFLERLKDPTKNWKFSAGDLDDRALFPQFTKAFEQAVNETATEHSPWYVLPADQKWYTRYLVSEIVVDAIAKCNPHYPAMSDEDKANIGVYVRRLLGKPEPEKAPAAGPKKSGGKKKKDPEKTKSPEKDKKKQ